MISESVNWKWYQKTEQNKHESYSPGFLYSVFWSDAKHRNVFESEEQVKNNFYIQCRHAMLI